MLGWGVSEEREGVKERRWRTVLTVFGTVETLHSGGCYIGERAALYHGRSH
jgi:hypothetical protein